MLPCKAKTEANVWKSMKTVSETIVKSDPAFCFGQLSRKQTVLNVTHSIHLIFFNWLDDIPYIWTGGRKCNFKGCERKDLQPSIVNGWFWASTNMRIPNKRRCKYCDWSKTGG